MSEPSKERRLKRQLIRQIAVATASAVAVFAVGWFVSDMDDSVSQEIAQQKSRNNSLRGEYNEIKTNLGIGSEVSKFYETYISRRNPSFVLDRDAVSRALSQLRQKNHLADQLEATVSPIADVGDSDFDIKSGKLVRSTVRIQCAAVSDSAIYSFIGDLKNSLPGILILSEIKMEKKEDLTRTALQDAIYQHVLPGLVTADLTFTWVGIRPVEPSSATSGPAEGSHER